MKVLILRTFSQSRVWEEKVDECQFTDEGVFQNTKMILELEPKLPALKTDEFKCALGIYTSKYFTYHRPEFPDPVWRKTPEEDTISLLKLRSINDKDNFVIVAGPNMIVGINFVKKINGDRNQMTTLDNELVKLKAGKPKNVYSLCFTLSENVVQDKLKEIYNVNLTDIT